MYELFNEGDPSCRSRLDVLVIRGGMSSVVNFVATRPFRCFERPARIWVDVRKGRRRKVLCRGRFSNVMRLSFQVDAADF